MGRRLTELINSLSRFRLTEVATVTVVSFLIIFSLLFPKSPFFYLPLKIAISSPRIYDPSCNSRHHHQHQRSGFPQPSPYFLSKLRQYKDVHRLCSPLSESFNRNLNQQLNVAAAVDGGGGANDCIYIVYTPSQGLGNRILGMSSTFLYALLTNRVLLVKFGSDMGDLFCEPFANSTWYLPETFPYIFKFYTNGFRDAYSYGNMLKRNESLDSSP